MKIETINKDLLFLINERGLGTFTSVGEYVAEIGKQLHRFDMPPEIVTSELKWFANRLDAALQGKGRPVVAVLAEKKLDDEWYRKNCVRS
jgi:hypothetical protein